MFDEYKRIIKTLLFAGASREIKTNAGLTAIDLLAKHESVFEDREYKSLQFILSDFKELMCFQRHRPIRKVERSPAMIIGCLLLNAVILAAFYLSCLHDLKKRSVPEIVGISIACFFFIISLFTFLASITVEPGYLKPKYTFIWLVDNFLENNIHLDNLCVFCEIIKSDSSFHCTICNRCSANYDHHCPFIDNCLGTRNHKFFLAFIFSYLIYSLLIVVGAIFRFYYLATDDRGVYSDTYESVIMFLLVILPLPVLIFQIKEQLRNLGKEPQTSQITGSSTRKPTRGCCNCWNNLCQIFSNSVNPHLQQQLYNYLLEMT